MVSHDPPTVSVSFTHPSADRLKDTAANILATKEFTVNIISEVSEFHVRVIKGGNLLTRLAPPAFR